MKKIVVSAKTIGRMISLSANRTAARCGFLKPARTMRRCSRPISFGDFGTKVDTRLTICPGRSVSDKVAVPTVEAPVAATISLNRRRSGEVRVITTEAASPLRTATAMKTSTNASESGSCILSTPRPPACG